jgi:hypothetical protein
MRWCAGHFEFGAKMALLALKIARAKTYYKFRLEFAA